MTLTEVPFGSVDQIDREAAWAPEPILEIVGFGRTGLGWFDMGLTDDGRLTFSTGLAGLRYLAGGVWLDLIGVAAWSRG